MVRVVPCSEPAKVMVAPNSPSALAKVNTTPESSPGHNNGSVMVVKVRHRDAPSDCAIRSYPDPAEARCDSNVVTIKGNDTNVWASTTAVELKAISIPIADRCSPIKPRRPNTSVSKIPATTGGMTNGTRTITRTKFRPRKSVRANTRANGTPSTIQMSVAVKAVRSDNHSASSAD